MNRSPGFAILSAALIILTAGPLPAAEKKAVRLPNGSVQRAAPFDASRPISRTVGKSESLRFLYGTDELVGEPVSFRVSATTGWKRQVIFEQILSPGNIVGWHPASVDLRPFEGKKIRLTFEAFMGKSRLPSNWAGLHFGNFTRSEGDYNVILISLDTLRADRLGINGYRRDTSPNIDALGAKSAYFTQGIAAASWTKPSHASMFTGLYPASHHHSFRLEQEGGFTKLPATVPVLAEILQQKGYVTGAFTGGGYLSFAHGFDRGFDLYQERRRTGGDAVINFNAALGWLATHKDDRFFLFVHTFEIHEPYRHDMFVEPGMSRLERLSARYDSGVRFTDGEIGRFIEGIRKLGLENSTLLVIVSDHGDELYDHGYTFSHGHSLYDELIRVPMLFHNPQRIKPRLIDGYQAHHVDLTPTILDFVGIPALASFQGKSLLPLLTGGNVPAESVAFSEMEFYIKGSSRRAARRTMLSVRYIGPRERSKLIIAPSLASGRDPWRNINAGNPYSNVWLDMKSDKGRLLFDLIADPQEKKNIAVSRPDRLTHVEAYIDILKHLESAESHAVERSDVEVSDELREQLKSLGY